MKRLKPLELLHQPRCYLLNKTVGFHYSTSASINTLWEILHPLQYTYQLCSIHLLLWCTLYTDLKIIISEKVHIMFINTSKKWLLIPSMRIVFYSIRIYYIGCHETFLLIFYLYSFALFLLHFIYFASFDWFPNVNEDLLMGHDRKLDWWTINWKL